MNRRPSTHTLSLLVVAWLAACGGNDDATRDANPAAPEAASAMAPEAPASAAEKPPQIPSDAGAGMPGAPTEPATDTAAAESAAPAADESVIEESELVNGGTVEIKEYSVAFIGSGSLGKGTLVAGGASHPFRIGGLGIGGIGIASIDARGKVYNLNDLNDFPGAYGKARLGVAVADAGEGKLWLKNTNGVVLELWSEMAGLALSAGVDGIVVQWESDYQSGLQDVKDGSKKAWEGTKKGAKGAVDAVKKPFE
jgi:hypothetical protein